MSEQPRSAGSANTIALARAQLLAPYDLDDQALQKILNELAHARIDFGDVYFQLSQSEGWMLEDGIVREGSYSREQGAGLRAVYGEQTGFAYSEDLQLPALLEAARTARNIGSVGRCVTKKLHATTPHVLYDALDPLQSIPTQEKIALLERADRLARAQDPRVKQVFVSLAAVHDIMLVINTDGTLAADVRPLVRFNISVIVEQGKRREQGSAGGGARTGLQLFDATQVDVYVQDAVRQALLNLEAIDAPAGVMPVVLGSGWPGVLLHEAVGHGLEGDFNRKGSSAFSGRIGEQVASPLCTVVDDGTLTGRRGSLNVDDEGTPTQHNILIENGILKGYLLDKHNARLMGKNSTGSGRRESYAHLPMPRMTNTYMLAGQDDPHDIIRSVKRGLYAVNFGGGQVDITSGKFVFSAAEAYLIEDGKITAPVKGATLIGNGPEVMQSISRVGHDLKFDSGVGTCGKEGQSVPVGVGQPTLKIDSLTVGGTAA
ncbi:MAG: metalloprotease TldD [Gammaproteobacteria bacterium]|nr:metalloprotease TldD [Gammaproteobacteria bacterium]